MATVQHELVAFVSDRGEAGLKEMLEGFAGPRGLTRGTVVKMVDRLFKKGLLKRRLEGGVFRYGLPRPLETLETEYVEGFVRGRLGGQVAPLLAFLSEANDLTDAERETLRRMEERVRSEVE